MTVLYNDDCLVVMDKLIKEGVKVDLIITSPPYNLKHNKRLNSLKGESWNRFVVVYDEYADDMSDKEYIEWQVKFLDKCYELLKDDGAIYYNHKEKHIDGVYTHPNMIFEKSKLKILQNIIWDRVGGFGFNCGRFVDSHELIVVGYKDKPKFISVGKHCEHKLDVWSIPPNIDKTHPASFPIDIPRNIIKAYKDYDDIVVLDPFMGSGTTGVASKEENRKFIGIELDKKYFDIAKKRIEHHLPQMELDI